MLIIVFLIILGIGLIIAGSCYGNMISTYKKYSKETSSLNANSLTFISACIDYYKLDTKIAIIDGELTDAYSCKKDIIMLSKDVAYGTSVADLSVASHEFGHALQNKEKSSLLIIDNFLGVLNRIANFFLPIALISCLIFLLFKDMQQYVPIIFYISVGLWFTTLLFKIITVPLELNASKRAYKVLSENKILTRRELKQTKKVLNAAALTYIGGIFVGAYKIFLSIKKSFRR